MVVVYISIVTVYCRFARNRRRVTEAAVNIVCVATCCNCRHAISLRISQPVCSLSVVVIIIYYLWL